MEYRCKVGNAVGKAGHVIPRDVTLLTAFMNAGIVKKKVNKNYSRYSTGTQSSARCSAGAGVRDGAVACFSVMLASIFPDF